MSKKRKNTPRARERPQTAVWLTDDGSSFALSGYTPLNKVPEIVACVNLYATLIASMTIRLMENGDGGDIRIYDELSRKIDIDPWRYGTRHTFMQGVVRNMLLDGNAVVLPKTAKGLLDELVPIPTGHFQLMQNGYGYYMTIDGVMYAPEEVLHFVCNPDPVYPWQGDGFKVTLRDVAQSLKQTETTKKGFMESKWKPSLIVKVDALVKEFAGAEGRQRLLDQYMSTSSAGEPWLIPAQQFQVEQVKPLSLNDLAISDSVEMDKKTVASVFGVPAFVLGIGAYNQYEWQNFISSRLMPIAKSIEQELTRKLLISPKRYFSFSNRSLYNYDIKTLADVADNQYVRGIMTRDEVRDWLSMPPIDKDDPNLVMLENYIPAGMIGDQKKLNQKEGENND